MRQEVELFTLIAHWVVDDADATAAQTGRDRIGDRKREVHRRRRVDCIAALGQCCRPHFDGKWFVANNLRRGFDRAAEAERAAEVDGAAGQQNNAGRAGEETRAKHESGVILG